MKGRKPITPHYSAHDGWDKLDAKKLTTRSTPPRQGARNLSRATVPCHQSNSAQRPASPSRKASTVHTATTGADAVYLAASNESLASDGARALKGCAYRVGMRPATPRGVEGTPEAGGERVRVESPRFFSDRPQTAAAAAMDGKPFTQLNDDC